MRLLIVETDFLIADDLAIALRRAEIQLVGVVATPDAAFALLDHPVNGAVMDIGCGDHPCWRLATELRRRAVPILFLTGYDRSVVPPEFGDVPFLRKPQEPADIVAMLERWCGDRR